jgi:predicted ArsR family transcriptional regulator
MDKAERRFWARKARRRVVLALLTAPGEAPVDELAKAAMAAPGHVKAVLAHLQVRNLVRWRKEPGTGRFLYCLTRHGHEWCEGAIWERR